MKNTTGNLFATKCDALCVTTNGFVKANGESVMGRGCAKTLADNRKEIPAKLGYLNKRYGNIPHFLLLLKDRAIWSFPVKPESVIALDDKSNVVKHWHNKCNAGIHVPGFAAVADIDLIVKSAKRMMRNADLHDYKKVLVPRPGCGAGELDWADVEPVLADILDDRFTCITF